MLIYAGDDIMKGCARKQEQSAMANYEDRQRMVEQELVEDMVAARSMPPEYEE